MSWEHAAIDLADEAERDVKFSTGTHAHFRQARAQQAQLEADVFGKRDADEETHGGNNRIDRARL